MHWEKAGCCALGEDGLLCMGRKAAVHWGKAGCCVLRKVGRCALGEGGCCALGESGMLCIGGKQNAVYWEKAPRTDTPGECFLVLTKTKLLTMCGSTGS